MGHLLGLTPVFGHFRLCHLAMISTLNLDHGQRNLVGPKMKNEPQWQRTWSRPELRRNGRFYIWLESGVFGKNPFFFLQKRHPKSAKRLISIGEKGTFFLHNFTRSWLERGVQAEVSFFGPKIRILAQKSIFCYGAPRILSMTRL